MKPSKKCYELIKQFEGLSLKAYKDPIGIPTIGYGTIRYETGEPVRMGELISTERAEELLINDVAKFADKVNELAKTAINQNQFDALVSFCYNLGSGALKKSTLLRKVNKNPGDPSIEAEFMKWVNAGGKELPGLVKRRQAESDLYFSHGG